MIDVHEIQYIPCETLVALTICYFQYGFVGLVGEKSLLLMRFVCDHKVFLTLVSPADRRIHQNALLESVVLMKNSIFENTYLFQQKSLNLFFTNTAPGPLPKGDSPGGGI